MQKNGEIYRISTLKVLDDKREMDELFTYEISGK